MPTIAPCLIRSHGPSGGPVSALEKHRYTLLVITVIDLKAGMDAARHRRDGEVDAGMADLEAAQWRGRLL